jgi:energy-coupling factor transport system permease protein
MNLVRPSPLSRMNPTLKLLSVAILTVPISFAYDPFTPLALLVGCWLLLLTGGRIGARALLHGTRPFLVLGAGFTLFTLLSRGATHHGPIHLAFLSWKVEDLSIALSLGLRIVAVATCSAGFVMTTDPVVLMESLMRQLRVPPLVGYATLAAYRFLPGFSDELEAIRLAQAVRGVEGRRGPLGSLDALRRHAVPLLAQTVRRAERVAMAMESRAFGAYARRTHMRDVRVRPVDWVLVVVSALFIAAVMVAARLLGVSRLSVGFGLG